MSIKISKNRLDMGSTPIKAIDRLELDQIATPADPGTGKTTLYTKSDGKIYHLPTGGAETQIIDTDHSGASAAVHGLPASVNVLGDRSAAGEFVQRGSGNITTPASTAVLYPGGVIETFAVAFSAAPIVVVGGLAGNLSSTQGAYAVTTTGFSHVVFGENPSTLHAGCGYIALGG